MRVRPTIRIHSAPADTAGIVFAVGMSVLVVGAVPVLGPLAAASVGGGVLLAPLLRVIRA
jgi:hypothetical protein